MSDTCDHRKDILLQLNLRLFLVGPLRLNSKIFISLFVGGINIIFFRYLQHCRGHGEGGMTRNIQTHEIVNMTIQVTQAMMFLHKRNILHKDLATRNAV